MTVGPDLLKAAEANDPDAIDMMSIWGLGFKAELGSSLAPGLWMHQGAQRSAAADAAGRAVQQSQRLQRLPERAGRGAGRGATFILGERDMMTPAKAGKTLAAATVEDARTVVHRVPDT